MPGAGASGRARTSGGARENRPPETWIGRSLRELDLGVDRLTAVALRRGQDVTVNPTADVVLTAVDELILLGRDQDLERIGS